MKYYIAFDGGGTKIDAILFDENLRLVKHTRAGSMNVRSSDEALLRKNADECMDALLAGTGVTEIENVFGVMSHIMTDSLRKKIKVNNIDDRGGEGFIGLLSAFAKEPAVIALSGTGSVIFYCNGENSAEAGGYGAVIHDEGSGYHMGRMAFAEAIKDFEQRGEKTLITDLICKHFGTKDLGEATVKVYYTEGKSPTAAVASCAGCVGEAARMGDKVAQRLLCECGVNLAEQAMGLIRRRNVPMDVPIVLEGGHFKNDRRISDAFIARVKEEQPERQVIIPYFEPIVGAVMVLPFIEGRTLSDEEIAQLKEEYKDFRYIIKE